VTARSAGDEDADQRARHGSRTHKLDRGRRLRVHPAASAVCAPAAAWAGASTSSAVKLGTEAEIARLIEKYVNALARQGRQRTHKHDIP
jgi:hypothetical protein